MLYFNFDAIRSVWIRYNHSLPAVKVICYFTTVNSSIALILSVGKNLPVTDEPLSVNFRLRKPCSKSCSVTTYGGFPRPTNSCKSLPPVPTVRKISPLSLRERHHDIQKQYEFLRQVVLSCSANILLLVHRSYPLIK